jgi:4-alpha-glucanotransferase
LDALGVALQRRDGSKPEVAAVADYLARTPSRLLIVTMEDVLGVMDQPNIPGTVDQHPNWRRRLPVNLEDLQDNGSLVSLARVMGSAGRSSKS